MAEDKKIDLYHDIPSVENDAEEHEHLEVSDEELTSEPSDRLDGYDIFENNPFVKFFGERKLLEEGLPFDEEDFIKKIDEMEKHSKKLRKKSKK